MAEGLRQKLIERGVLKVEGDEIVFTRSLMGTPQELQCSSVVGVQTDGRHGPMTKRTIDAIFRKSRMIFTRLIFRHERLQEDSPMAYRLFGTKYHRGLDQLGLQGA